MSGGYLDKLLTPLPRYGDPVEESVRAHVASGEYSQWEAEAIKDELVKLGWPEDKAKLLIRAPKLHLINNPYHGEPAEGLYDD